MRKLPAGQSNYGRAGQVGVLQPGRQIDGADGLGHAEAGASFDTGVSVGHVSGSLFPVRLHALDPQLFHFHESSWADVGHEENMGDPITMNCFGDKAAAGHVWHLSVSWWKRCWRGFLLREFDLFIASVGQLCNPQVSVGMCALVRVLTRDHESLRVFTSVWRLAPMTSPRRVPTRGALSRFGEHQEIMSHFDGSSFSNQLSASQMTAHSVSAVYHAVDEDLSVRLGNLPILEKLGQ